MSVPVVCSFAFKKMKITCSAAELAAPPSLDNCVRSTAAAAAQIEAESIETLPVWHATARMAAVTAAGVIAAGLIAGLGGCANMSGIAPQSTLRDAASLALPESLSSAASSASSASSAKSASSANPVNPANICVVFNLFTFTG